MIDMDYVRDLIERHSDEMGGNSRDFHNGAYAAIAEELNTRAERTCENEWAKYGAFRCSKCWLQIKGMQTNYSSGNWLPNYCPGCGAKVVG